MTHNSVPGTRSGWKMRGEPMEKLKQMPIWVCCKIVDVNGRKTKIPCAAGGGSTGTSKDYAHTWLTYDEAMEAMKHHGYAGVGFIIPKGVFFIDKDHIDPNDPLVQMLREKEAQPVQQELIDEVIDEDDPRIEDIIAALRWDKNAPKFIRLFDNGDITGYGSQSEADAALCAIIAFRAGPNPALIDAIFRKSELYRDGAYRLMSRTMMLGVIKQFIIDYDENLVKTRVLNEVYDLLLTDNFFVSEEDLNSDEDVINFQNGLLRLSDMTLLPHTPDQLSTIQLPCDWPPAPSETPVYDRYMQTLTQGNKEHIRLLEEFAGVCLSNIKGWRMAVRSGTARMNTVARSGAATISTRVIRSARRRM